jgi:hypothetical protein
VGLFTIRIPPGTALGRAAHKPIKLSEATAGRVVLDGHPHVP